MQYEEFDYRELLKKYLYVVATAEGVIFDTDMRLDKNISRAEIEEIHKLCDEIYSERGEG
jgi:hypothetical protein